MSPGTEYIEHEVHITINLAVSACTVWPLFAASLRKAVNNTYNVFGLIFNGSTTNRCHKITQHSLYHKSCKPGQTSDKGRDGVGPLAACWISHQSFMAALPFLQVTYGGVQFSLLPAHQIYYNHNISWRCVKRDTLLSELKNKGQDSK